MLFDCRFYLGDVTQGRLEYEEEHIPGAIYLDLDKDLSGPIGDGSEGRHPLPDVSSFIAKMQNHGVNEHSVVVAYDQSAGAYASRLWWMLKSLGCPHVYVLNGGWNMWKSTSTSHVLETSKITPREAAESVRSVGAPLSQASGMNSQSPFSLKSWPVLHSDGVFEQLQQLNLVDSRTNDRYLGQNETIDPVAGHIPGAHNLPWTDNVDASGTFLPIPMLYQRFKEVYSQNSNPVFYCGSGVTACHNILATQVAGFPMPDLFAASWSGWISDPKKPVDTQ